MTSSNTTGRDEAIKLLNEQLSTEQISEALEGVGLENADELTKRLQVEAYHSLPMSFEVFEGCYDLIGGFSQHVLRLGHNSVAEFVADKNWAVIIQMPEDYSTRAEMARPIFERIFNFAELPSSPEHFSAEDIERWEKMSDVEYWDEDDHMIGTHRNYKEDENAMAKASGQFVYVGLAETAPTRMQFDYGMMRALRNGDLDAAVDDYLNLGAPLIFKLYLAGEFVAQTDDSTFMLPLIKGGDELEAKEAFSEWINVHANQAYADKIETRVSPAKVFRPDEKKTSRPLGPSGP